MSAQHNWDQVYEPLMKLLLHKKGLKTKDVIEVGKKVVTLIRGKDVKEFLTREANQGMLKKKFPAIFTTDVITEENATAVGKKLLAGRFISRVVDQAFKTQPASSSEEEKKKKPSWPERIARAADQEYDPRGFYMVVYENENQYKHLMLGAVIIFVLFLCMFPAWPMYLKVAGVHVVTSLATALIILSVVRLIFFVIVWCFGADFWIFPNMNDEYLGIVDSFKPAYSFEWRNDTKLMMGIRLASLAMIAVSLYQLSLTHTLADVGDFVKTAYLDSAEWMVDKITKAGPHKALPSMEKILEETAKFVDEGEL